MYELSSVSIIALCLVSFIGVPHGSFDGAVAALLGFQSRQKFALFIIGYIFISAGVIIFWIFFPVFSLIVFILMSIIHFGLCDWSSLSVGGYKWPLSLTHGMNILLGIIFFHTHESFEIFIYLSNKSFLIFKDYLIFGYIIYMALLIYYCFLAINIKTIRWGLLEMLLILITVSLFDPLTGFALYFCFIHTYKHIKAILSDTNKHLTNKKFVFLSTTIFTIITWIGGCLAIVYLRSNFSFDESFIKTVFIGLAALTLPHMVLVDLFYRKKFN
jgi:Brp/Blh family beta-carotene 15,15'-monooxygenase